MDGPWQTQQREDEYSCWPEQIVRNVLITKKNDLRKISQETQPGLQKKEFVGKWKSNMSQYNIWAKYEFVSN